MTGRAAKGAASVEARPSMTASHSPRTVIPAECKRLAEVDFPIAAVSRHAAREKSIRHGHPSTLHLWWARRPLASSRAVLLALLLPDPCDPACPSDFKSKARAALPRTLTEIGPADQDLRQALLRFISEYADWDNCSDPVFLGAARNLVKAAYGDEAPLVVDPFSGGGSIPLESIRSGCDAFASDLNPVATLLLQTLLVDVPKRGAKMAEELRQLGAEIQQEAEKELLTLYPVDADGHRPIAYLWARTVRCESPNCGAEIPLIRTPWLSKKAARRQAFRYKSEAARAGAPTIFFELFEPHTEKEVQPGTVKNAKATCIACGTVLASDRIRAQLTEQRGGSSTKVDPDGKRLSGATLLAVVTAKRGGGDRNYRLARPEDYRAVGLASKRLHDDRELSNLVPTELINPIRPSPNARGLSAVTRYGMERFGDLFTPRQLVLLTTLIRIIRDKPGIDEGTRHLAGLALSRYTDISSALCRWEVTKTQVRNTFTRQALTMKWDFAEPAAFGDHAGVYGVTFETMARVLSAASWGGGGTAQVQLADARASPLPDSSAAVWFTDPPYYDAIPYADLSDYFFVWLKRVFPGHEILRDPFDRANPLTPKEQEAVWNESYKVNGKTKDGSFFELAIAKAAQEGVRVLRPDGIACVVFAHTSTEGWEALLSGMLGAGWVITASWPIATEMSNRTNARDAASLMGSIHLVCRPRGEAKIGDWAEIARELPLKVKTWMDRLTQEGVRGADLVFACIGPAMEVFSRYSKVLDAEDREIPLGGDASASEPHKQGYLAKVWEVVGRLALEQVLGKAGSAGSALEEDARLTALFLWALQSTNGGSAGADDADETEQVDDDEEFASAPTKKKGFTLPYDVVRRFAQPLGIHLETWEGRIAQKEKGVVRLLPIAERAGQLFGEGGTAAAAEAAQQGGRGGIQATLFPNEQEAQSPTARPAKKTREPRSAESSAMDRARQATTLDRVHAAMLLQHGGETSALRLLLTQEKERGADFERLANALAALYPRDTDERRLVEAMLLAMPK